MANFRSGNLQQGAPLGMIRKQITLVADNTVVDVNGVSMLYISSDSSTATARTFTITSSTLVGHELTLVFESGSSNSCELADSGNMKLSAGWTPLQYDALKVFWDGAYWVEISRTAATGTLDIPLAEAHILVGNSSGLAADVAVSGDISIGSDGAVAITGGAIVNADVNGSAAIAYSKLAALTSAQIIVGNGSNVPTAVAVTGDVTISNAGVTAIEAGVIVNADVNGSAAIDFSKLAALPSAQVLVGNGSNVATAVAMSGDVTISNAGVTAIGAAKVTEAMLTTPGTVGLQAKRIAYGLFDPTTNAGQRTQAAHVLGATIPDNAFVTGMWYWVETTATSGTDAATIALSIEAANDCVSAIAINDGSNPWDTSAKPVEGIPKLETTSTWLATTAARAVTATVAVEDLTGGKIHVWAEYIVFG